MKYKTKRLIVKATALILALALLLFAALLFSGCSNVPAGSDDRAETKTTATMRAIIKLPNGEIVEGKVDRWSSGYASVTIVIDGVKYQTQLSNVVIITTWE